MRKLIVNADDFGLTEGVNRAILEGHQRGIITNASLLANGEAFDAAVKAAAEAATLGVGVHLNLTNGLPTCDPGQVPSLLSSKGIFPGGPGTVAKRILKGETKLEEVECEWRAQIAKVVSAGIRVSHLDSHKHIHLLPPLFDVVIKLAREYQIACVRNTVEPLAAGLRLFQQSPGQWAGGTKQFLVARALSALAVWQRKKLQTAGLSQPDRFFGLSQTGFLDARVLREILQRLPEGTSEMICHPGYVDAALLGTRTRLRAQRETELAALTQPGLKTLVSELGIKLISYGSLAENRSGNTELLKSEEETPSVQKIARKA